MFNVLVNIPFEDAHTHSKYAMGDVIQLSKERIEEVQSVDKRFITVLGEVEEVKEEVKEEVEEPKKPKTTKKSSKK